MECADLSLSFYDAPTLLGRCRVCADMYQTPILLGQCHVCVRHVLDSDTSWTHVVHVSDVALPCLSLFWAWTHPDTVRFGIGHTSDTVHLELFTNVLMLFFVLVLLLCLVSIYVFFDNGCEKSLK